jgi:hypothetical protein
MSDEKDRDESKNEKAKESTTTTTTSPPAEPPPPADGDVESPGKTGGG